MHHDKFLLWGIPISPKLREPPQNKRSLHSSVRLKEELQQADIALRRSEFVASEQGGEVTENPVFQALRYRLGIVVRQDYFRVADHPEVIRPVLRQTVHPPYLEHPSAIGLSNQLGRFVFCPSPITSGYSWLRTSQNTIPRASAAPASAATVEGAV